ncbi:autotransporter outer membrane beta-barrel domain-containing protein [uncultured Litoreibacter sp.]|uniref:autotransporter outer membrane beta-barrel domain-containing protein n=1 Tax=uncultured Litoreibacter sp. TaxID=1392394 RepID=UPI00262EF6A9|nr:autotransporter outer membrane beta-barrel domain-containing protein [uncultured Litoreibacter sp.]
MITPSAFRKSCIALSACAVPLMAPTLASAQMYPTMNDPRSDAIGAHVGGDIASFRDAIAQRRGRISRPQVLQESNSLSGGESPSWGGISSAWASADTKRFNGTYSGNSTNLIFGADTLLGDAFAVGIIAGYNNSSVDVPAGQRVKAEGLSIGTYFSAQLSDTLNLDGFVGFGKPDYNVDGGQFSGDKTFGNLTLTGSVPLQRAELSPFISVASVREKLPAFTSTAPVVAYAATEIKSFVATIGTGVHYNPIDKGNLTYLPNAGFEVDYVRNDDGFGTTDSFTAPRISGGVTILSDTGAANFGAHISRTSEGTTTVGANASYFWQF